MCRGRAKCDLNLRVVDLRSGNDFLNDTGDMSEDAQDANSSNQAPVSATAPGEAGWSVQALVETFGKRLPWWLRKMGVWEKDVEDATQEVFIEVFNELHTIPKDVQGAQNEMVRLASRVACRKRRAALRDDRHVSDVELRDHVNREEWIAMRMLWAEALKVLDEPALKLFIAHDIEGRSYASIAAEMGQKEDTIEKRGATVKARLRTEIERLLGKNGKRNGSSNGSMALVLGLSPFDRALFRTLFDMEEQVSVAPPITKIRSSVSIGSLVGGLPMALLVGAVLMLPAGPSRQSALWAAKIGEVQLPDIVVKAELPSPGSSIEPIPAIMPANGSRGSQKTPNQKLDKATKASLVRVNTPSLR